MICARCDRTILPGEDYETRDLPAASGAGSTVYLHKPLCRRPVVRRSN